MGMGSLPYGKSLVPRPLALLTGLFLIAVAAGAGWFAAASSPTSRCRSRRPVAVGQGRHGAARAARRLAGRDAGAARARHRRRERPGARARRRRPRPHGRSRSSRPRAAPPSSRRDAGSPPRAAAQARARHRRRPARLRLHRAVPARRERPHRPLHLQDGRRPADRSCIAPVDDPLPTGSCPADISTIAVSVPAAPDAGRGLKSALPRVTGTLDRARMNGRLALRRGADSDAQVSAARSISAAYGVAADEVAKISPEKGAALLLPEAFRTASAAYAGLAAAARSYDKAAWDRASPRSTRPSSTPPRRWAPSARNGNGEHTV